ncbi:hypothetical protein AUR64_09955 [Haloprofundus marisrubri]|uniref:Uncharacterized protein n=1 Tax=Haloprofundus marisrubri TaxID=1514971 RepID=A0A0W1R9M9_9EURY|nr:hypothetical protein [Haloprofundus marisrubri]KTG09936.1 hypothetical protein AUR64_09955 [Haloprofundus marisrubri]
MPVDIRDHPDAPDLETLGDITLEPVSADEIRQRLDDGDTLLEDQLRERDDIDAYVELNRRTQGGEYGDIGTALYRLVQLFGTPQLPGYEAGSDISERSDETFKYLFRVSADSEELPDEWLVTVHDWHVDLGVCLAGWESDGAAPAEMDTAVGLVSLALVTNVVTEPVQCEFKDIWY